MFVGGLAFVVLFFCSAVSLCSCFPSIPQPSLRCCCIWTSIHSSIHPIDQQQAQQLHPTLLLSRHCTSATLSNTFTRQLPFPFFKVSREPLIGLCKWMNGKRNLSHYGFVPCRHILLTTNHLTFAIFKPPLAHSTSRHGPTRCMKRTLA